MEPLLPHPSVFTVTHTVTYEPSPTLPSPIIPHHISFFLVMHASMIIAHVHFFRRHQHTEPRAPPLPERPHILPAATATATPPTAKAAREGETTHAIMRETILPRPCGRGEEEERRHTICEYTWSIHALQHTPTQHMHDRVNMMFNTSSPLLTCILLALPRPGYDGEHAAELAAQARVDLDHRRE